MNTAHDRSALLIVDIQPDFLPGGRLAVAEGDLILDGVRKVMSSGRFPLQIATQDWHPPGHISFASTHAGKKPFDVISLYGREQVLWPDHCVQGSAGAELYPELPWETVSAVIRKGSDPGCDSYSGLRNNWNQNGERPPTGLGGYLRERGIESVFLCGLARDYCVRWTAEDAAALGLNVAVIWDLTRPVDRTSDEEVRSDLMRRGVEILTSAELA